MAGHDDAESFFDDDDLDTLPNDALLELENNAIQFTQAQTQARLNGPPSSDYGDDFEDEDLEDAVIIDESRSTPTIVPQFNRFSAAQTTQREQFRQQRYGSVNQSNSQFARPQPVNTTRLNQPSRFQSRPPVPAYRPSQSQISRPDVPLVHLPASTNEDSQKLKLQIEEQNRLIASLKDELHAKTGEISIVRSKQEKEIKEHERELAALRKQHDDKVSQQLKALEAARTAEKNAAVERDFLKRDLAEETGRNRQLLKDKGMQKSEGPVSTPKKQKKLPHRDGFDDDEIEVISPSKVSPSKFQKRLAGSPSKPGKRKRKTVDSPAGKLDIHVEAPPETELEAKSSVLNEALIASLAIKDDRYDFLGSVLDHHIDTKHLRTVQELGKYALPSGPQETLESILLGKLPALGIRKTSIAVEFCQLLISLWKSCSDEKYYQPTYLLIDMLTFILEMITPSIASEIIKDLVPVAVTFAESAFEPRFRQRWSDIPDHVDTTACLNLLYLAALECMSVPEQINLFWASFDYIIIQTVLSATQLRPDFEIMLKLLSTSVRKDGFGAIHPKETYEFQTRHILDRLMHRFIAEIPVWPMTGEKFDAATILSERYQIVQLLVSMTRSTYTGREIAVHPEMIGGIVCLLSDTLDDLYDYKGNRKATVKFINLATRFLSHMVTNYGDILDMQEKLAAVCGGSQKYMLCLSRLAYIDFDLVLESGIDPDVSALASDMLADKITPEEADAIDAAFQGP